MQEKYYKKTIKIHQNIWSLDVVQTAQEQFTTV